MLSFPLILNRFVPCTNRIDCLSRPKKQILCFLHFLIKMIVIYRLVGEAGGCSEIERTSEGKVVKEVKGIGKRVLKDKSCFLYCWVFLPGVTTRLISSRAFFIHSAISPPNPAGSVPTGSLGGEVFFGVRDLVFVVCVSFSTAFAKLHEGIQSIRVEFPVGGKATLFCFESLFSIKDHQKPPAQCCLS